MLNTASIVLLSLVASPVLPCTAISGKYESYSETHWHVGLEIKYNQAKLTYSDYSYGVRDTRTDFTKVAQGYCEEKEGGYLLIFADQEFPINYDTELSHASFGEKGSSPGVRGEFLKGQEITLWVSQ